MTDRPHHDADDPGLDEAALGASYGRLQGVIDEFREDDAEITGTLGSLRNRVMDIVHRESVLGPTTELSTPSGHRFEMLTATIRQIIRDAADQESGLIARRVRVDVDDAGDATGGSPGRSSLTVRVSVTIQHDISVPAVDARLRSRIAQALGELVGSDLASLDIQVEDIHDV
ncbi:Asp23/Gls24 family envelope stress response protein [Nesterenkonia suensis]